MRLLRYGFPLILLAFVTPVLTWSDRFFLKFFQIPLEDIGVYSIAYKFGMIINVFLVVPLQRGWGPMMYRLGVKEESRQYHRDVMFYFAVAGSFFLLVISLFSKTVLSSVATEDYVKGAFVIPIVASAYLINGFRQFFSAGAALRDKTPRLALAAAMAIGINVVLNYVLVGRYGIAGAAWATLISYVTLVAFVYLASQRLAQIDWRWDGLFRLALVVLAVYFGSTQTQAILQGWENLVGVAGVVVFILLLWITRVVGHRELTGIRSLLGSLRSQS